MLNTFKMLCSHYPVHLHNSSSCKIKTQFSSVAQSCPTLCNPMNRSMPGLPVHHQLPEPTQSPLSPYHLTISSSVVPFSYCLQSSSGSFPMDQLFASGDQTIGASASKSVLPKSIQGWLPLRLTCLISLLSKGFSRVFSSTTDQKHQFFSTLPFLWSNSHIHTWPLEKS